MLSPDEWKSREWPRIAFGWSREAEWAATIRYAWLRMIERVSEPSFLRFLQLACFREMRNNPLFVMHTRFRRRTERKGEEEEKKRTIGGEGEGRRKRNSQVESGRPPLATENAPPRGAKYANDDSFKTGYICTWCRRRDPLVPPRILLFSRCSAIRRCRSSGSRWAAIKNFVLFSHPDGIKEMMKKLFWRECKDSFCNSNHYDEASL